MKRHEHVYIRLSNIERYLNDLARFHADAGRPAHVAGVRSALQKIKREVARSDKVLAHGIPLPTSAAARTMARRVAA